ncbi:MAG: peptide deformylase [Phycisphaerales bacterium JB039]
MPVDPANLRIELYPAPCLRQVAAPVEQITPEVRQAVARMAELMYDAEGIGLAAPQVGLAWRIFVCHVPPSEDRSCGEDPPTANDRLEVFINPVIEATEGAPEPFEEGCLSLPDIRGDVLRPPIVTLSATDIEGQRFTRRAGGLLGRCWLHEFDHLEGVLILDRMTQMGRLKNRSAIRSLEREGPRRL